jgi:hypothetical protein
MYHTCSACRISHVKICDQDPLSISVGFSGKHQQNTSNKIRSKTKPKIPPVKQGKFPRQLANLFPCQFFWISGLNAYCLFSIPLIQLPNVLMAASLLSHYHISLLSLFLNVSALHGDPLIYIHMYWWLKMGFGLVIGFINHLQVVTANNYYTIADLHNLHSLHANLLSLFQLVFTILSWQRIYNTGTVQVSLITRSQYRCTTVHAISHTKSSNSSGHTAVPLELRNSTEVNSQSRILSYPLGTDHAQKTQLFYCCVAQTTQKTRVTCETASSLVR